MNEVLFLKNWQAQLIMEELNVMQLKVFVSNELAITYKRGEQKGIAYISERLYKML